MATQWPQSMQSSHAFGIGTWDCLGAHDSFSPPVPAAILPTVSTGDQTPPSGESLEGLFEFETLISDLSSRFVDLPPGGVDSEIDGALRRVCEFLGVDRSVLWQWSIEAPAVLTPTHIHSAQESPGSVEPLRNDPYPWVRQQILAGRTVVLCSPEELPAEAAVDRETARRLGLESGLVLPLSAGASPWAP